MDNSLKKFNQLPKKVKDGLSATRYLGVIEELEVKYQIKLVVIFIKLIVGDLVLEQIGDFLVKEYSVAEKSALEIKNKFSILFQQAKNQFPELFNNTAEEQPIVNTRLVGGSAAFNFSTEDEDEVKRFQSQVNGYKKINYNDLANLIINDFDYNRQNKLLKKRLRSVIVSNLRDVRDDMETREILMKNKKIGGLEFSAEQVDRLLSLVKERKRQGAEAIDSPVKEKPKAVYKPPEPAETRFIASMPVKKPFASNGKVKLEDKIASNMSVPKVAMRTAQTGSMALSGTNRVPRLKEEGGLPIVEVEDDLMIKPVFQKNTPASSASGAMKQIKIPEHKNTKFNNQQSIISHQSSAINPIPHPQPVKSQVPPKVLDENKSHKPKLSDVKFSKQLVGPVEELANMTLIDFRRLGLDIDKIISEIKEKIGLLEKDSYAKKIEGINAWNKNEVNRFYRLLGQKSMSESRSIEEIIKERLALNKPTLSIEEFNAIMKLNKDLRF